MSEHPLISIIVPVYRVEKFLDRCVKSLVGQTYENIEIILVDDGSPDKSGSMCDAWAERDPRIKVLHKENGGLSDARNRGVETAGGEYISFVDSDDYVSPDYVEYLLGLLRGNSADIACGSWRRVYEEPDLFENQPQEQTLCFDSREACKACIGQQNDRMVIACAKLVPAAVVRNNPFPVGRLHEDEATTYKYYHQAGRTAIGSRQIYAYYCNNSSITHTRGRRNQEHTLLAMEERCEYFRSAGDAELCSYFAERSLIALVSLAKRGEEAAREYIKQKQAEKYLNMGPRAKYRVFFRLYELFGIDVNALLIRIKNAK